MLSEQSIGIVPVLFNGSSFRYLLIQHKAGHWGFPKGHAENDESLIETATREFYEETGLKVDRFLRDEPFVEAYVIHRQGESVQKIVKLFLALGIDEPLSIPNNEIIDGSWLPFEEAIHRATYPQTQKVVKESQAYLMKHPFT